jgi:hypothetical protein
MLAFKTHAQASPAHRDSAAWGREESNCQRGKWKYSARIGPRKRRASSLREVACIRYEKQSRAPDRGEARRSEGSSSALEGSEANDAGQPSARDILALLQSTFSRATQHKTTLALLLFHNPHPPSKSRYAFSHDCPNAESASSHA